LGRGGLSEIAGAENVISSGGWADHDRLGDS